MLQVTGGACQLSRPKRRLRSRLGFGTQVTQPLGQAHMADAGLRGDDLVKQVAEAPLVPSIMSPDQLGYQLCVRHDYLPPAAKISYAIWRVKIYLLDWSACHHQDDPAELPGRAKVWGER